MVVMGVGAFILCTGHRWRKTKIQQPWNKTKQIFPEQKQRSLLLYVICVQYMKFWVEFWNPLIPRQILSIHWVRESVHLTIPLATMSQQGHACWQLRNWSTSTWLVCGHFIQIHSCMGICFSCMYTNNCEHFHKWFGTLDRNNSVLMRVPHIQ